MKAKVLLTGEIVDVSYIGQRGTVMTNIYMDSFNRTYAEYELEFINETDESVIVHHVYNQVDEEKHWQDVRERAAIAALSGLLADSACDSSTESMVKCAIEFANELVRQLKGK